MSADLQAAIESNNAIATRDTLKSVRDINAKLPNGKTPVLLACEIGANQALEALLEAKAKVQGKYSDHPFYIAAQNGHHKAMSVLVARKKVNDETMDNVLGHAAKEAREETLQFILSEFKPIITPGIIRLAIASGKPNILRLLAQSGADLNAADSNGEPAFYAAVRTGSEPLIRAAVECRANLNIHNAQGATPLMELAQRGGELDRVLRSHLTTLENLKERAKTDPVRAQALLDSASRNPRPPSAEEALTALLNLDADAALHDDEGNDALDYYRFQCRRWKEMPENPSVIALLQKAGSKGHEPTLHLFKAIHDKDLAALQQAIVAGADVNRINPASGDDNTPLTLAAESGLLDIVNALIDAGADLNKLDRMNRPLLIAAQCGKLDVVKRLIEAGADPFLRHARDLAEDCPAMNACETADWNSQKEVRKYLKSIGADRATENKPPEPGVQNWEDFAEILIKADLPAVAKVLAEITGGKIHLNPAQQSLPFGKRAFVIAQPLGMDWSNVFQLAPAVNWLNDSDAAEKFAADFSKATGAPTLYIGYSDTSDVVGLVRFEPNAKPKLKNGKESDNDWLTNLARKQKFLIAAFRPVPENNPIELLFPSHPPETFKAIALITT